MYVVSVVVRIETFAVPRHPIFRSEVNIAPYTATECQSKKKIAKKFELSHEKRLESGLLFMQSGCTVIECQSKTTEHTMKKKQTPSSRKCVPSKMKGRKMPPRAQIVRLARIASLLKRNSCPTAEKLLKEYRDIELVEGKTIRAKYSLRTVYRDIDLLRSDFECPIAFDRANKT